MTLPINSLIPVLNHHLYIPFTTFPANMNENNFGGPIKPIKVNEITGLVEYLQSIDWTEPWFVGLAIFHIVCAILTVVLRRTGVVQSVYFAVLIVLVFCAEYINQWAASNWSLFSKQQYFDSNGLFISVVFSVPILINCLVILISWLWDVGFLISDVKQLKIKQMRKLAEKRKQKEKQDGNQEDENKSGDEQKEGKAESEEEKKEK